MQLLKSPETSGSAMVVTTCTIKSNGDCQSWMSGEGQHYQIIKVKAAKDEGNWTYKSSGYEKNHI